MIFDTDARGQRLALHVFDGAFDFRKHLVRMARNTARFRRACRGARHLTGHSGYSMVERSRIRPQLLRELFDLEVSKLHFHGRTQVDLKSDPARFLSVIVHEIEGDLSIQLTNPMITLTDNHEVIPAIGTD